LYHASIYMINIQSYKIVKESLLAFSLEFRWNRDISVDGRARQRNTLQSHVPLIHLKTVLATSITIYASSLHFIQQMVMNSVKKMSIYIEQNLVADLILLSAFRPITLCQWTSLNQLNLTLLVQEHRY
jgi:hypothetical protein